jgi:hypothetical protein
MEIGIKEAVILLAILLANVWIIKSNEKREREKWEFYLDGMNKHGVTDFHRIKSIYDKNDKILNKRRNIK